LDALETDIWARVSSCEQVTRIRRRTLAAQVTLLGVAAAASAIAGFYFARPLEQTELSVFSAHMALNASIQLTGDEP
jgi:hypothetical protein